mmetsp:Transcript_3741/g.13498  ORF Transcript_3741/g.13498 Transcript_3741/m.13498 type:complete len:255 (-) Transcript_3741:2951-3715(-)
MKKNVSLLSLKASVRLHDLVPHVLELLHDLPRRPVELLRYPRLDLPGQLRKLLTQAAVNDVPDRVVGRPEGEVVPAAQRRVVLPEVHLEVREKVGVLFGGEGNERADLAEHGDVQDHLLAARLHGGPAHGRHGVPEVEAASRVQLVGGSAPVGAISPRRQEAAACGVVLHLPRGVRGEPADKDVSKLVPAHDRVVVQRDARSDVPRDHVVREHVDLVVLPPVPAKVEALLGVPAVDPVPRRLHGDHKVRKFSTL